MLAKDVRQLAHNLLLTVTYRSLFPIICRSLCQTISLLPCLARVVNATRVISQTSVLTVRFMPYCGSHITSTRRYRLYVNKVGSYTTIEGA